MSTNVSAYCRVNSRYYSKGPSNTLEIIIDLPIGFPINNIISPKVQVSGHYFWKDTLKLVHNLVDVPTEAQVVATT